MNIDQEYFIPIIREPIPRLYGCSIINNWSSETAWIIFPSGFTPENVSIISNYYFAVFISFKLDESESYRYYYSNPNGLIKPSMLPQEVNYLAKNKIPELMFAIALYEPHRLKEQLKTIFHIIMDEDEDSLLKMKEELIIWSHLARRNSIAIKWRTGTNCSTFILIKKRNEI